MNPVQFGAHHFLRVSNASLAADELRRELRPFQGASVMTINDTVVINTGGGSRAAEKRAAEADDAVEKFVGANLFTQAQRGRLSASDVAPLLAVEGHATYELGKTPSIETLQRLAAGVRRQ